MNVLKDDLLSVLSALCDYERQTGRPRIALGGWVIEDPALQPPVSLVDALRRLPPRLTQYADVSWCFEAKAQAAELFNRYLQIQGAAITPTHVTALPSGANGLLLALTFLRDHGIRTIYAAAPNYFATFQVCRHLGLQVEIIPPQDFLTCQLDYDRIAHALQTPDSAFVLTNPAYSVGVEYTPADLTQLFAVVPEQAYVVLDEVYLGLNWQADTLWEPQAGPPRVIRLRSPSKLFLLYGVKLCFLIAPPEVIQYADMLAEFLSSLPGNFEDVALAYLHALAVWDQEVRQAVCGEFRQWHAQTVACFARNLHRLTPLLAEFHLQLAPINSGPYVTVAVERERVKKFDPVALARQDGVLFITAANYYHDDPRWFGFRLNLCGNSRAFAEVLPRVLPKFLPD